MLDPTTMKRLAFIRYMYDYAMEQSRQPEPLREVSVLTFRDCSEWCLTLAAEHIGVKVPDNTSFMGHWHVINGKLTGEKMGNEDPMRRLVKARKDLKHDGTLPHVMTIEMVRSAATGF